MEAERDVAKNRSERNRFVKKIAMHKARRATMGTLVLLYRRNWVMWF